MLACCLEQERLIPNQTKAQTENSSRSVSDIDWDGWQPVDRGTLLFVIRDGQVLLIHKKRGLGAGKINGPGGRLDPGETPLDCAVREVQEELIVTPLEIGCCGELLFQFLDGYSIHVWVFRAADCTGEPQETAEAIPQWTPIDKIPYDQMWQDDRIWLPRLLANEPFLGRFIFDQETMLDYAIEPEDLIRTTIED